MTNKNVCLVVIDGWGISPTEDSTGDAIRNAKTPVMTGLSERYPYLTIGAHGLAVGLPEGLMGNSEVGHLNIGAGRVVYQDIVRIELTVKKRQLGNIPALKDAFCRAISGNGRIHFLGLVSDGGVHSHINHLLAMLDAAKEAGVPNAFVHFFGDGRDASPKSAITYLDQLLAHVKKTQYGRLSTIMGRYYAMDRDKRWERVKIAYEGLMLGTGEKCTDPKAAIEARYATGETDEFLKPIIVDEEGCIRDNDTLIFFNFRSDRMRQITETIGKVGGSFPFDVPVERRNLSIATMTEYKSNFPFPVLFAKQEMKNVLAEWLASKKIKQCHVAETEKYAHVTFFFNGGTEQQFDQEDRRLLPSPKVATYDLQPKMSALEVGKEVASVVESKQYPFIMCNFAPPDMVGHTGKYEAAVEAVEATDKAIGDIYEACKKNDYILFVTADHGNAEKMLSDDFKTPHTAHTTARVPFVMTSKEFKFKNVKPVGTGEGDGIENTGGALCDVAPTILAVLGIEKPYEMTGTSLIA